jgi:hypothetical protein
VFVEPVSKPPISSLPSIFGLDMLFAMNAQSYSTNGAIKQKQAYMGMPVK